MQKIMDGLQNKLAPLASKIGENRILKTVSTAFNMIMSIIIIGAIFTLLSTLQLGPYQDIITKAGLKDLFSLVGKFTTDLLAVYVSFTAAYSYLRNEGKVEDAIPAGLLSILAFFIMTPLAKVTIKDVTTTYIAFDFLGAKGLFTALIVGILVGFIYIFIVDRGWVIKMPEGVPPTVSKSFSALIPGFVITAIFLMINGIFNATTGVTFSEWFYSILATPLSALSGSILTYVVLQFLSSLFWFFGLHGGQITGAFSMILFMQAGLENQTAFAAGQPMQNILTVGFGSLLMLGGIGISLGLALDMFIFSKSKRYKSLGKLEILPALCGINEPIMFGMPIILNPIMMIPFFVVPQIVTILTYLAMKIGIVGLPRLAMSTFGTPVLLDGWMMCGISGSIWQIIMIALSALLYYPFFKMQDNTALKEEQGEA